MQQQANNKYVANHRLEYRPQQHIYLVQLILSGISYRSFIYPYNVHFLHGPYGGISQGHFIHQFRTVLLSAFLPVETV